MTDTETKLKAIEMGVDVEWALACRQRYIDYVEAFNKKAKELQKWAYGYYKQFLIKDLGSLKESRDSTINKLAGSSDFDRFFAIEDLKSLQSEIESLEKRLKYYNNNRTHNKFKITQDMIQHAKDQTIEQLLPHPVKNKMTNCFNHEDKHPSMSIKNNKVHCFVCDKTWDTIAAVQEVKGLTFPEAVRVITNL